LKPIRDPRYREKKYNQFIVHKGAKTIQGDKDNLFSTGTATTGHLNTIRKIK
jgi:hypothetical protein